MFPECSLNVASGVSSNLLDAATERRSKLTSRDMHIVMYPHGLRFLHTETAVNLARQNASRSNRVLTAATAAAEQQQ
jgi:hypothetical protein